MLIGLCGFMGSGKSTVASHLCTEFNFVERSFASALKNVVSSIFSMDREMLEGKKGRELRESPDLWWSEKLGYSVSPRSLLQIIGTDVFRAWNPDIWVLALERSLGEEPTVIADVRWKNEAEMIRRRGGIIIRVKRGDDPLNIHHSESEIPEIECDYQIENNGTLKELGEQAQKTYIFHSMKILAED